LGYEKVISARFQYQSNQNSLRAVADADDLSGGFLVDDENDLSGGVLAEKDEFSEKAYLIEQRIPKFRVLQIRVHGADGQNCGINSIELKSIAVSDSLTVWK